MEPIHCGNCRKNMTADSEYNEKGRLVNGRRPICCDCYAETYLMLENLLAMLRKKKILSDKELKQIGDTENLIALDNLKE